MCPILANKVIYIGAFYL